MPRCVSLSRGSVFLAAASYYKHSHVKEKRNVAPMDFRSLQTIMIKLFPSVVRFHKPQINGAHLDWSLGYMVDATNRIPEEKACVGLSPVTFCGLLIIFIITSVVGLLLLILGIKTLEGEYVRTKSAPDDAEDV